VPNDSSGQGPERLAAEFLRSQPVFRSSDIAVRTVRGLLHFLGTRGLLSVDAPPGPWRVERDQNADVVTPPVYRVHWSSRVKFETTSIHEAAAVRDALNRLAAAAGVSLPDSGDAPRVEPTEAAIEAALAAIWLYTDSSGGVLKVDGFAKDVVLTALKAAYAVDRASAPDGLRAAGLEFFRRCWEVARDIRDIEGSDIQDWGYELGLLTKVTASAPCGEGCVCEDIVGADFPTECYRPVVDGAALGSAPPEPSDEERVLADAVRAAAADTAFVREQYDGVRRVLLRLTQFRTTPPAPSVEPRVVNRSDEEFYRSQLSGIVAQAQGALSQFPELITGSPPPEPWSTQELYHVAAEVRHRGSLDNAVSYLRDELLLRARNNERLRQALRRIADASAALLKASDAQEGEPLIPVWANLLDATTAARDALGPQVVGSAPRGTGESSAKKEKK